MMFDHPHLLSKLARSVNQLQYLLESFRHVSESGQFSELFLPLPLLPDGIGFQRVPVITLWQVKIASCRVKHFQAIDGGMYIVPQEVHLILVHGGQFPDLGDVSGIWVNG